MAADAAAVRPFTIAVPDAAFDQLRAKLAAATFPDEVAFSHDWNYGAPLHDVRRLAKRWHDGFDWRAQEATLNLLPQYTTSIAVEGFGELTVHLVHRPSSRPGSIPLLFCHGWPGSFLEVTKLLPLLTEPTDHDGPSFHVVAPSLPNFAFSQAVSQPGFGIPQYAECMHKVMLRLGYDQYATQAGDWGFFITRVMGLLYPNHCLASHVNFLVVRPSLPRALWLAVQHALGYTPREKAGLARTAWYLRHSAGYMILQSTKPATLGFALADSPLALLAWVYEKLHDWTDAYPWSDDEILTWLSIYHFSTAGPAASLRIYYEALHAARDPSMQGVGYVPTVPLGVSYFPKDVLALPKAWASSSGPVVFEAVHTQGGHFAAYERPDLLAADLRQMFGSRGGASHVAQSFQSHL